MDRNDPDMKADREAAQDRGENVSLMEPLLLSEESRHRAALTDLAVELGQRAAGFRRSLPDGVMIALADLVRSMNCYYSNLIEGHDTHPIDIERALRNDYSTDPEKRNLQLEAKAHIAVQRWIDDGGMARRALTADGIREIHRRFCDELPDALLEAANPDTGETLKVMPGAYRTRDVKVGRHVPVSPGAVPRFMERFERGYAGLGKTNMILASAAAHHRLAWIHPFLDGNGRVMRLMSHTVLRDALDTGGVWSIARGLARNVDSYKMHLAACDLTRRNDLDGRGNLSEETLAEFSVFFLETCIDQVKIMETLVQPDQLHARILLWAEEEVKRDKLPPRSGNVLEAILYRGELPRGDVADLLQTGPRNARRAVAALTEAGVLASESSRAPLFLAFPATLASRWMPGLFPDK